jgi:hypothetical protein
MLVSFLGLARIVAAAEADESKAADSCNHANLVNRQSMMRHLHRDTEFYLVPCLLTMKYALEETMTILTWTND